MRFSSGSKSDIKKRQSSNVSSPAKDHALNRPVVRPNTVQAERAPRASQFPHLSGVGDRVRSAEVASPPLTPLVSKRRAYNGDAPNSPGRSAQRLPDLKDIMWTDTPRTGVSSSSSRPPNGSVTERTDRTDTSFLSEASQDFLMKRSFDEMTPDTFMSMQFHNTELLANLKEEFARMVLVKQEKEKLFKKERKQLASKLFKETNARHLLKEKVQELETTLSRERAIFEVQSQRLQEQIHRLSEQHKTEIDALTTQCQAEKKAVLHLSSLEQSLRAHMDQYIKEALLSHEWCPIDEEMAEKITTAVSKRAASNHLLPDKASLPPLLVENTLASDLYVSQLYREKTQLQVQAQMDEIIHFKITSQLQNKLQETLQDYHEQQAKLRTYASENLEFKRQTPLLTSERDSYKEKFEALSLEHMSLAVELRRLTDQASHTPC
eukprot:GILJ01013736.1.p1 GENE.GILJ01013736.1~~GILJ01013736.1.p1  ORF type:complete len:436 (+),score=64.38 GILJ01013736.1:166-1473(+)